mmetsp:Transcript_29568/g.63692  ORF Transcript_29568/g.63692 Transcript_29568/m.63692 type:complete len:463 (+) Transcript_29568:115-1503(+)
MRQHPLESPPFQPATVRNCIKMKVLIQNLDEPEVPKEVILLTPASRSVESILSVDPTATGSINNSTTTTPTMNHDMVDDTGGGEGVAVGGGDGGGGGGSDRSYSDGEGSYGSELSSMESSSYDDDDGNDHSDDDDDKMEVDNENNTKSPTQLKAFLKGKKPLCENKHGPYTTYVYHARVLRKAQRNWIATGEEVAIKEVSWQTIRASLGRTSEDFLKEIAALRYVSDWHDNNDNVDCDNGNNDSNNDSNNTKRNRRSILDTHILAADVIMSNETDAYIVMPFCAGGDLMQLVAEKEEMRLTEDGSRFWFRQILKGLESLQLMRICHKDLSPENFIILDNTSLVIDFGMCLRIPYSSAGRHFITPKTACGKKPYVAPEIYMQYPFDGHAVDIWAAGTTLLFMLTGKRLHNFACAEEILYNCNLGISNGALDLLRRMLRIQPRHRLSFEQIRNHPWVQYEQEYM